MTNTKNKIFLLLELIGELYAGIAFILAFADNSSNMFINGFVAISATGIFTLVYNRANGKN